MKKAISMTVAVLLLLLSCVGCTGTKGNDLTTLAPVTTTAPDQQTEQSIEPTKKPNKEKGGTNLNPLTGKHNLSDAAVGKRPVAVMINNIKAALPQYGTSAADIMFEAVVEGGITRMMAIYSDYTQIPDVCSIRSCRYYYPIFAMGYDAIYVCWGGNKTLGYPTLKRIGINYFDGAASGSLLFGRDSARVKKYASEHTGYLKGANIPQAVRQSGFRSDLLPEKTGMAFNFGTQSRKVSDKACTTAQVTFSSSYYSTFKYDSQKGYYYKFHSGQKHMDSRAGKQLSFKNIFVLQTDVHLYKDNKIIELDWTGGTGYYISQGTVVEITWTKPTESSYITYYNKATGKELVVNPGKSFIAVCKSGQFSYS